VLLSVGSTVVVVVEGATVVVVVVVVEAAELLEPPLTTIGVVSPGAGFHPGGGFGCEGTGGRVAITTAFAGIDTVGGWCSGTGVPGAWTRPKPARSDHQMELTWTTVPVWGALIISPSPM
jgi:hypothetical protein